MGNHRLCVLHNKLISIESESYGGQSGNTASLLEEHGVNSELALGAFYIFSVATIFSLNAALWSVQKGRSRLNLQVAYISAIATYTHYEMWLGRDWYVTVRGASVDAAGGVMDERGIHDELIHDALPFNSLSSNPPNTSTTSFSALRVLEWVFTTPVLLLLVQHLHEYAFAELPGKEVLTEEKTSDGAPKNNRRKNQNTRDVIRSNSAYKYKPVNRFLLIAADELMIVSGVLMPVFPYGLNRLILLTISMASFFFVIAHSVFALVDVMLHAEIDFADGCRLFAIAALKVVAWSGYPLVYFLTEYGVITVKQQHEFYLYNDVLTKFSYSLMISAGSLRCLDLVEEHRAKIATQMSEAQRAFFFNVTHELRTPLNSIIGFNTLAMESGELTDFTNSFIKASLTSAEALLGLINQILDFAKFEGAKNGLSGGSVNPLESAIELSNDAFTLRQLIEQVTDMTQKGVSAKVSQPIGAMGTGKQSGDNQNEWELLDTKPPVDIVVTLSNPDYFASTFVGDFFRVRQCCVNLVDNAVKYASGLTDRDSLVELIITVTPMSDASKKILKLRRVGSDSTRGSSGASYSSSSEDDVTDFNPLPPLASVTFEVKDNGVGIPVEKQHSLFVPFCQPAKHRAAKEKGTGLGLVITKSIVECMGGSIDFVSVEDVGTRFFFTCDFPLVAVGGNENQESLSMKSLSNYSASVEGSSKPRHGLSLDTVLAPNENSSGSSDEERSEGETIGTSRGEQHNPTSDDSSLPPSVKIILHSSLRAPIRKHVINILRCFRALPGTNYVVCRTESDLGEKVRQARRLGGNPVVFLEAGDDPSESAKILETVCASDEGTKTRVSFEEKGSDSDTSNKSTFSKGVVVFGRPKQLMDLRKVLGDRCDVAMVFEPAKPSELLSAVRKVSDVLGAGYGKKPPHPPSSVDLARHGFGLKGKEEKLSGEEKKQKGHTYSPTVTKSRRTSTDKNPKTNDLALSGLTVLLVEDNVMNQQMARHSIVSYGVELTIVGDGEQAVKLVTEKLKENNFSKPAFDVILMDVMMPVKDGLVATREIRELESSTSANTNRHVIIGLSANVGTEYVNEVSDAGMDGVVSKPFYPATLRKALSDVSKGTYVGFNGESGRVLIGYSGSRSPSRVTDTVEDDPEKRKRRVSTSGAA
tara:strand:+ start:10645 stop:14103 length:3459 start_codon:yes stop_codon:yes gene_type:complete